MSWIEAPMFKRDRESCTDKTGTETKGSEFAAFGPDRGVFGFPDLRTRSSEFSWKQGFRESQKDRVGI
jgi:hypothetical protein